MNDQKEGFPSKSTACSKWSRRGTKLKRIEKAVSTDGRGGPLWAGSGTGSCSDIPAAGRTFAEGATQQGPGGGCNVAEAFQVAFFLEEFRSLTPPTLTQTQVLH